MDLVLSRKIIDFVKVLNNKNNGATKDDFKGYPLLSYYAISKYLRENNLIKCVGVNDRNQKIWALTDKGKRFTELVLEIEKVLNNGQGNNT